MQHYDWMVKQRSCIEHVWHHIIWQLIMVCHFQKMDYVIRYLYCSDKSVNHFCLGCATSRVSQTSDILLTSLCFWTMVSECIVVLIMMSVSIYTRSSWNRYHLCWWSDFTWTHHQYSFCTVDSESQPLVPFLWKKYTMVHFEFRWSSFIRKGSMRLSSQWKNGMIVCAIRQSLL